MAVLVRLLLEQHSASSPCQPATETITDATAPFIDDIDGVSEDGMMSSSAAASNATRNASDAGTSGTAAADDRSGRDGEAPAAPPDDSGNGRGTRGVKTSSCNSAKQQTFATRGDAVGRESTVAITPSDMRGADRIPWQYAPRQIDKAECGYVGLENLGATCYMNSLLQQLFMVPALRFGVLSCDPEKDPNRPPREENLLYQLQVRYFYEAVRTWPRARLLKEIRQMVVKRVMVVVMVLTGSSTYFVRLWCMTAVSIAKNIIQPRFEICVFFRRR